MEMEYNAALCEESFDLLWRNGAFGQRGDASAEQQQRALRWLIEQAAGTYEFAYYPSDRDTAFALGRGFVGQQVVKLLKLNLMSLRRLSNANPSTPAPTS
jgi:hypothetical protein